LMSISQDERERAVFRSRRMYQTDMQSNIATAEDRGRAKGIVEGRVEGRVEGKIEIARNLIKINMPLGTIVEVTGLPPEEVNRLYKEI